MDRKNPTRQPAVAGAFYPGTKNQLENTILGMLDDYDSEQVDGQIIAIISPHAGYVYSGRIAARAFKQIQSRRYDNVIVIAPSHFEYFEGCSIYFGDYKTPLGIVSTNIEIAESMVSQSRVVIDSSRGHFQEHSLEVQIPFLQVCLRDFKLVPVSMGNQEYITAKELSNTVCTVLSDPAFKNQANLIVGSSDLSHYYPARLAKEMDGIVINDIEKLDERRLYEHLQARVCEACGYGAVLSTMMIAKALGADKSEVLDYGTSGEVSQDYNSVVGYASAVLYI